ncbi:hypothetical protein [Aureimonas jatrophae]|uniref:Uncharacterized protein n=1 Tax=Aureimonas jatrophae TaxID=1166073 RepID=A0A1H0CPC1_9HYPH|nr:hypothetical protein [Aureimonas jatrophae]MBB3949322.1 hypothetical protein [Aureimonas jatrophae]SDN59742.1 hypothetical protein SAMN05192530_101399 [Aureimonas jatrophae]
MGETKTTRVPPPRLSERLLRALTQEIELLEGDASEGAGGKARVEAISLLARTLEKLLDLSRLEREPATEGAAGEGERLRKELMRRLRALHRREAGGEALA